MNWMIYGANGYTGELIAREAQSRGLSPVLAGRKQEALLPLSRELGLELRVFGLEGAESIQKNLDGIGLVLHCAGPFSATSANMIDACLRQKTDYLDITGEIEVLEHAQAMHSEAARAGIVVCSGVGFDVIPTDCVAAALKQALPDATRLALGFDSRSPFSKGTAKSSIEGLALGGRVRENGVIVQVPLAHRVRQIDFGDGEKLATTIPWGDVSTAYTTTGIPNIEVYIAASPRLIANVKRANALRWLLGSKPIQSLLKLQAGRTRGPTAEERATLPTFVWGEAENARGEKKIARIRTGNGYQVTVSGSLHIVSYLLRERLENPGRRVGSMTPAKLLGPDLVTKLPGSGPLVIE